MGATKHLVNNYPKFCTQLSRATLGQLPRHKTRGSPAPAPAHPNSKGHVEEQSLQGVEPSCTYQVVLFKSFHWWQRFLEFLIRTLSSVGLNRKEIKSPYTSGSRTVVCADVCLQIAGRWPHLTPVEIINSAPPAESIIQCLFFSN
jgi:hypothetical protein